LTTFGTIFGISALVCAFLSFQAKTRRMIIKMSLVAVVFWVLYFFAEGAYVSAIMCFVSILRLALNFIGIDYKWAGHIAWLYVFLGLILLFGIASYAQPKDLIPTTASLLMTLSTFLKKERSIRIVSFAGISVWIVNGLLGGLWFALISDVCSVVSIVIAIIRYDILKKEKVA